MLQDESLKRQVSHTVCKIRPSHVAFDIEGKELNPTEKSPRVINLAYHSGNSGTASISANRSFDVIARKVIRPDIGPTGRATVSSACCANHEEEFIDGGAANLSFGDSALPFHDNPRPLIRDCT